jgi:hypothetical protein
MKNEWQILAEKLLFDYGKEILGKNAGGMIAKLFKVRGIDGARNAIKAASDRQNPVEYIAGAIRKDEGDAPVIDYDAVAAKHGYVWNGEKYVRVENGPSPQI